MGLAGVDLELMTHLLMARRRFNQLVSAIRFSVPAAGQVSGRAICATRGNAVRTSLQMRWDFLLIQLPRLSPSFLGLS